MFVIAALAVHQQISPLVFWVSIILFGGGGLMEFMELLNPAYFSTTPTGTLFQPTPAEQIKRRQEEPGIFTYAADGFALILPSGTSHYQWQDIQSIFAYVTLYWDDRCYVQEIALDLFTNAHPPLTLVESIYGWHQFVHRLSENIPAVPQHWVEEIQASTTATKRALLFDKQARTKEQAEQEYYSERGEDLPL